MKEIVVYNNSLLDYFRFLVLFLIGIAIVIAIKIIILSRLKKWSVKTVNKIDDFLIKILQRTLIPLLFFGAFYLSIQTLHLSESVEKILKVAGVVLLTILGIRFVVVILEYVIREYWLKKGADEAAARNVKGILPAIKVIIWGIGIIFLLDNLNVKISTVVAGLGIGGIAVALAAQAVLGDLFCYFAILFDQPFEVGDFIIIGDFLGTVEHIGIKTTRIRSLSGEQLVFSNTDLTNSRLRNFKRMDKRRILFKIGVTYQTTTEQLKEITKIIPEVINNIGDTVFDRAHFSSFGDFSLIFEVVYYVLSRDYNKYMDIQQEINFKIKNEFEKRGIEFAYPTQTLFISKE